MPSFSAALLEDEVRDRTRDAQAALQALNDSNARREQGYPRRRIARRAGRCNWRGGRGLALFGPDEALR